MSDTGGDDGDPVTRGEDVVDSLIGRVLGSRYRVEALLGKGAMGAVYRARHVKLGRPFAVKVLHERLLVDPKLRKRFEREAELAGKLHHINVIGVVDVGETEDGIHFMVMEFAEGRTLGSLVDGPMESARAINLAQQLCDGLQHAHEHGLIHRDFKPENIIVEKDRFGHERPRIVDFGIAILRDDADDPEKKDRLTTAGLVLGTPHYMAPEHAMGAGIDHRIDLFALGVIMYELLTGWLPFDGDGVDVARANLIAPTPPMGVRVPGVVVDPLLEAFTRLLMQKKPADRPESAKAARHLLDLVERDRPMAARILGVVLPEPAIENAPNASSASNAPDASNAPNAPNASRTPNAPPDDSRAMHRPVSQDTAPPIRPTFAGPPSMRADTAPPMRPTFASTPSTRADTAPPRGPPRSPPSSLSMGAVPSPSMEPLPRSRGRVLAMFAGALAVAAVIVVIATRSSSERGDTAHVASAPTAPVATASTAHIASEAGAITANVLDAAVANSVPIDSMLEPEGSATAVVDAPSSGTAPTGGTNPTDGTNPTGGTNPTSGTAGGTNPTSGTNPTDGTKAIGTRPTGGGATDGTKAIGTKPTGGGAKPTDGTKPIGTKPTGGAKAIGTKPSGTKPTDVSSTNPTGRAKPVTLPATAPDTSSTTVANLYGIVGRELKALDTKRGPDVAQPMWGRFRQLRINDALQTPENRAAAEKMLSQLRRDIAAAM